MVQRKGKAGAAGGGNEAPVEARVVLQAVLLADSFAETFRPITVDKPKVLLPLAGVPLVDYTLEWLASQGVEECFVLCCAHAQQVTAHLSAAGWLNLKHFKVTPVIARDCISAGDALRHIDQKGLVQGDFVLVSGDVVSNVPLAPALAQHRKRRTTDKQAVLTLIMRTTSLDPTTCMTALGSGRQTVGVDAASGQLLLYEPPAHAEDAGRGAPPSASLGCVSVDPTLLEEASSLALYTELEDCHVDICAPEVLHLYTDNFDYQHPRRDFVKGVLNDDIMGNKIFLHRTSDAAYAARVETIRSYARVSLDVVGRWVFPFTPESMALASPGAAASATPASCLALAQGNRYTAPGVSVSRSSVVGPNTLIGRGTSIGDGARVQRSVVGQQCVIGKGAVLDSSFIWDRVVVGEGVVLRHAVVCDGAKIGAGAVLEPGAVVSFNVEVEAGAVVSACARLSLHAQPEEEDSDDEHLEGTGASGLGGEEEDDGTLGGVQKSGRSAQSGSDEDARTVHRWVFKGAHASLKSWRQSCAPLTSAVMQDLVRLQVTSLSGGGAGAGAGRGEGGQGRGEGERGGEEEDEEREGRGGIGEKMKEEERRRPRDEEEDDEEDDADDEFNAEVEEFFKRAVEGVSLENVVLEVNTLKLAFNKTFSDCANAMLKAILNHASAKRTSSSASAAAGASKKSLLASTKAALEAWAPLLRRFLKSSDDEVEILLTLEEVCEEEEEKGEGRGLAPVFQNVLQVLYDVDCVSEEAVLAWANEKKDADEEDKKFLKQSHQFIKWLQEAEEEEEEED